MAENDNYYRQLLQQYLADELNAASVHQLFDYLQQHPEEATSLLEDVGSMHFEQEIRQQNPVPGTVAARMRQQLLQQIAISGRQVGTAVTPAHRVHFIRRFWWGAAAIILIIGATYFFVRKHGQNNIQQTAKAATMIQPGGDKAILTLADGRNIPLDTANLGTITTQNGIHVRAVQGMLTYSGEAANSIPVLNTVYTPRGGQYRLILPDGSKVWINSASSLRFPTAFSGAQRAVELNGEAYFEIAKDPHKPFIVKANGVQVQVLGTHFDVMAYGDEPETRTTLFEGSVKLTSAGNNGAVIIKPGEQASMAKEGGDFKISHPDLAEVLGWQQGEFRFEHASLKEIMKQISRWYDADIQFQNGDIQYTFSGNISKQKSVDDVLDILSASGDVDFKIDGKNIMVIKGKDIR